MVVFLAWRYYPQIEASAFDEEFARTRGVSTAKVFIVILAVTAVAVVLLQTCVGIVMVIAMLTLPAGTAGYFSKNLGGMMALGTGFSLAYTLAGLTVSWKLDLPSGAVVVLVAGAVFLCVSVASFWRGTAARRRK